MTTNDEEGKGICILSFDSGGPGTYSQLLILKEYTGRLADDLGVEEEDVYPADYFDLMGGVGFGGLVAITLGHLRMNVNEAIDALITVATGIFAEDSQGAVDPDFNSRNLENSIDNMLQTRGVPINTKMYERDRPQTRCKVVLYAATSDNVSHPQAFRTYSARGSALNPTIVEAVCSTLAIPSLFSPVKIGPRLREQSFIGGALGVNNPTRELLREASAIFGSSRRVAQLLSIGSGRPRVVSMESLAEEGGVHRLLKEIGTDCEMVAQELSTRLYTIDAYLRLNVERGMELLTMTDWNKLGSIASHTAAYVATVTVTGALDTSLRRLQKRSGALTLGQFNESSSINVVYESSRTKAVAKTAPSVSPHFVLRIKEWEKLVWHLVTSTSLRQRILPITGMGGCGKTQLVSYFLQRYPSLFKRVAYVDASTLSSIIADLQAWARTLGDGHERDTWEDAVRILSSASGDERWGLILDNADDPTLSLVPFIPKSINLTIVVTSRNRNVGNLSTTYHMELGEMDPEEALATLLHAARCLLPPTAEERKSANTLLKELGYLAVALVQAGTYCHELSISFTQYLSLFQSHRADLMKRAEPSSLDGYERGAYTTLDLSYMALPQVAREFLRCLSFFHHTDVPLAAFATAVEYDFEDIWSLLPRPDAHKSVITDLKKLVCAVGKWSEMQVHDTLSTLRSFSLLSITSIGENVFLQLHPLIQSWLRDMDPSTSRQYRLMAVQIITPCRRDEAFSLHRHLIPHILEMTGQVKSEELHINDLMAAGDILRKQGHYQAAAGVFKTALEAIKKTNKPREESTVATSLARVYKLQGQWSEAEKLLVEALEQMRRILGMEHPDAIRVAGNLASTYRLQGRWSEAEKLEVEVLKQWKMMLGPHHRDTIWAAANLARTYWEQGRWSEAEKLQVEALEKRKLILGNEKPDTIMASADLAVTYISQGRWEEASVLLVPAVQLSLKVLGQQHPHTQIYLRNLVRVYETLGKEKEAQETRGMLIS